MGNCWKTKSVRLSDVLQNGSASENENRGNDNNVFNSKDNGRGSASKNENQKKENKVLNSKGTLAIALYSLQSGNSSILNFVKDDKLIVEDDSDPDWCLVCHINQETKGYAPRTYLVFDTTVGSEKWFFGDTTRADAERLLLQPENVAGTFMIRNSHLPGQYALSLKDFVPETNDVLVRHYKIRTADEGGYYISKKNISPSLNELVTYYSGATNGLIRKLEDVCPRSRPIMPGPLPDTRDEYEIPFESLQFIRRLGKGNFGEVFFGIWNGTYEVAIKRLTSSGVQSDEFRKEVVVMKAINHPKIVRLFAICTEREPFCIVMEYLCNGNLQQYLKTPHGKQLRLPSLVNMAAQIADGMQYLESSNLIHRDLAARNILVGDGDIVKLADFGLARILDEAVYITKGGKFPIKWTAPEAYTTGKYTIKSDVWSYGIVLYEIFTHGEMPYQGMKNQQVSELVTKQNYRMSKPSDSECTDHIYEIMMQCWRFTPEDRPSFEYLFRYFTDYQITSYDFDEKN